MVLAATGRNEILVSAAVAPRVRELLDTYSAGWTSSWSRWAPWTATPTWTRSAARPVTRPRRCCSPSPTSSASSRTCGSPPTWCTPQAPAWWSPSTRCRPGCWSRVAADVVVGEGQSLGNHPNFGGPAFGFLACAEADVRRLARAPGRRDPGRRRPACLRAHPPGPRAAHQREKATSNIRTNQTLNAVAAAVYLSWLGPAGLAERELPACRPLRRRPAQRGPRRVAGLPGPAVRQGVRAAAASRPGRGVRLADRGWLAGLPLGGLAPALSDGLLVAVTERRTRAEIDGTTCTRRCPRRAQGGRPR